jgi:hypothetical protein
VACGFWFNAGMGSSATVTLAPDGSAGRHRQPRHPRAAQALMVAEETGIPSAVRPSVADRRRVLADLTGGSQV